MNVTNIFAIEEGKDTEAEEALINRIVDSLNEAETIHMGGLQAVLMGIGEIDACPGRIKDTGEPVLIILVKALGKTIPIGHVSKTLGVDYYVPRPASDFLD